MKTENLYTPHSIRTVSGQYVNLVDPDPNTIMIEDIAFALARECRFGNHLPEHFSVAQHCINCADAAFGDVKYDALMHDASEYLLGDICKPFKMMMPQYKEIETRLMTVIAKKFDFTWPKSPIVDLIDCNQLEREWDDLMLDQKHLDYPRIVPMSEARARKTFMQYFHTLRP